MRQRVMRSRQALAVLLGTLILVMVVLIQPSSVLAHTLHAVLLRSDPPNGSVLSKVPTVVHLWFSEPVQTVGQSISVINPLNKHVERGGVSGNGAELSVDIEATQTGTYLVLWQVISQDTDPAEGSLTFSVGRASAVPFDNLGSVGSVSSLGLLLQVLARWLHFVGYALSFGILAFLLLVLRPLGLERQEQTEQRLWPLIQLGLLVLLLAEPLALLAQMVSLTGQVFDANLLGDILASSFGRVLGQRLGAAILLWVLIGIIKQGSKAALSATLVLGVALAFVDSMASHASTTSFFGLRSSTTLEIAALVIWTVHIAAMGLWVGGLGALLRVWQLPELSSSHSEMVTRFGRLAALSLIWLIGSGGAMSLLHLAHPTDLFTTAYGRALGVKSLLVLFTLLLALMGVRGYQRRRERWWSLEAVLLAGVLVLAGILVSLPPPI